MQKSLQRARLAENAWLALMANSQDAIMLFQPEVPGTRGPARLVVTQVNARAQALLPDVPGGTLVGQPLEDILPEATYGQLHQCLADACTTRESQSEEHMLHKPGSNEAPRWLHHQIIPLDDGVALVSRDTSNIRQSLQAVHERETFYRTLVDCLPVAVYARSTRPSTAGEYVVWNKAAADIMQLAPDKVLGLQATGLLPAEVIGRDDAQDLCVLREPRVHQFPHLTVLTPLGPRIADLIKAPVFGADGEVDHILSIAQDVTEQRQAAEQLKLASRVIEETGDAVVVSDALDRIVMVNPSFLHLTGMAPSEVIGQNAELLGLPPLRESHLAGVTEKLQSGQRWKGESRQVCTDGRTVDIWLGVSTLRNEAQQITQHIRVFSDISVLKTQQRALVAQARHDSLTGLPNRRAFNERLNQAMARARRNPQTLAVLYVDLDGFKAVNDRFGHASGDAVLVETARRLEDCVRQTDCVCRLSGDEFTVILEGAGNPNELVAICRRILQRVSIPHEIGAHSVIVSPSIGVAIYETGENTDGICLRADTAMYSAKRAGKARFVISESDSASGALQMLRQISN